MAILWQLVELPYSIFYHNALEISRLYDGAPLFYGTFCCKDNKNPVILHIKPPFYLFS